MYAKKLLSFVLTTCVAASGISGTISSASATDETTTDTIYNKMQAYDDPNGIYELVCHSKTESHDRTFYYDKFYDIDSTQGMLSISKQPDYICVIADDNTDFTAVSNILGTELDPTGFPVTENLHVYDAFSNTDETFTPTFDWNDLYAISGVEEVSLGYCETTANVHFYQDVNDDDGTLLGNCLSSVIKTEDDIEVTSDLLSETGYDILRITYMQSSDNWIVYYLPKTYEDNPTYTYLEFDAKAESIDGITSSDISMNVDFDAGIKLNTVPLENTSAATTTTTEPEEITNPETIYTMVDSYFSENYPDNHPGFTLTETGILISYIETPFTDGTTDPTYSNIVKELLSYLQTQNVDTSFVEVEVACDAPVVTTSTPTQTTTSADPVTSETTATTNDISLNELIAVCQELRENVLDSDTVYVNEEQEYVIFSSTNMEDLNKAKSYCKENGIDTLIQYILITDTTEPGTITDVDEISEMLAAFITENDLDAKIVSDKNYPQYAGTVVIEFNIATSANTLIVNYAKESGINRDCFNLVPCADGKAIMTSLADKETTTTTEPTTVCPSPDTTTTTPANTDDLPQTGMPWTRTVEVGAVLLILCGGAAVIYSRKKQ